MGSEPVVCQRFSAADSDITIRSSDDVLFKVHRKNLSRYSDGFPAEDMVIPSPDEVVDLTETSETLELLFQYMYPSRARPRVTSLPATALFSLAEAAEKYNVSSAIDACMLHLRAAAIEDPINALRYGATHGHYDICDEGARQLVCMALEHQFPADIYTLDLSLLTTWRVYHEQYAFLHHTFGAIPELLHLPSDRCKRWQNFQTHVQTLLLHAFTQGRFPKREDVHDRFGKAEYYILEECPGCVPRSRKWSDNIIMKMPHTVPKTFSGILRG